MRYPFARTSGFDEASLHYRDTHNIPFGTLGVYSVWLITQGSERKI